jgi:hypothetical protein
VEANCTCSAGVFGGVAGCKMRNVKFFGSAVVGGAASMIAQTPNSAGNEVVTHISDSIIACEGLNVSPSGTLADSVLLLNPGTITMPGSSIDNSRKIGGARDNMMRASEPAMRSIRGRYFSTVAGAPRLDSGSGFTLSRNGTGDVTVNFSTAFGSAPAVIANCEVVAGTLNRSAVVSTVTTSSFRIQTYNAGAASDEEVDFLAMGV